MRHELKFNGAEDLEWASRAHMERAKLSHNKDTCITSISSQLTASWGAPHAGGTSALRWFISQ